MTKLYGSTELTNRIVNEDTARSNAGFTLIEFVVAMAVFMIVSAASFMLFNSQQKTFLTQQSQVGINIALRNAMSQMQMDVSNAGTAYFQGVNIPSWPVGVTVVNHVVGSNSTCYDSTTFTYTANCFDVLNIIEGADPTQYPPMNATNALGGATTAACSYTYQGTAYGQAANPATAILNYSIGDQLLFLTQNGQKMTSVVLTAVPTVVPGGVHAIQFAFNPTNGPDPTVDGTNTLANDPLDITACDGNTCPQSPSPGLPAAPGLPGPPPPFRFTSQFCGNDWIVKLAPIVYAVDSATDVKNPHLTRTQFGRTATVMDQIIGFKIGATIWNSAANTVSTTYNYDASSYSNTTPGDQGWNFSLVRSLRVSLIGRTTPNTNPTYTFRNLFDGGPYQVEGIGLVVNPRNMSMND